MRNQPICSVFLTAVTVPLLALAGDSPGFRGLNRDGKSTEKGLLREWPDGGPRQLWHRSGIGEGYSTVAVADDVVYATGSVGGKLTIFAFGTDGRPKWRKEHGPAWSKNYPGGRATPTVDRDRLYILSGGGKIGCYDVRNGDRVWTREMSEWGGRPGGWGYAESVLIARNLAIVSPGGRTAMVGLNKGTGEELWTSRGNGGGPHYSSAILVFHEKMPMVINGNGGGIYAVHPKNGDVLWTNDFSSGNTANCPTPAYSDGYVFWANGYGKGGVCLELDVQGKTVTADEAWRTRDMVCHVGGYVIHDGYIYGNHEGGWACLELKSGKRMWTDRGVGKGSVTYADGMLYTFSEDGGKAGLVEARPDRFEMRGQFSVRGSGKSWAYPVVADGKLFLRYGDNLYCFDVKR